MRLDQWLWAIRLFRSRSLATEAIRGGRVKINGTGVKPAHEIREGMVISATIGGTARIVRVIGTPPSRVGAKLVPQYAEDLTPKPDPSATVQGQRLRGMGRPTKRDRRQLDEAQEAQWLPPVEEEEDPEPGA